MIGKRFSLGAVGGGAAVLCAASVAWACTFQPHIVGMTSESGLPGSAVTVSGVAAASQSRVELHWNGAAGPLLGAASPDASGAYSIGVTIPANATPDVYYIVAVAANTDVARSAFEVTSATAPTAGSTGNTAQQSQPDGWTSSFGQSQRTVSGSNSVVNASDEAGVPTGVAIGAGLLAGGAIVLGGLGVAAARRRARAQI